MKKGSFRITIINYDKSTRKITKERWISSLFGIHKTKGRYYTVTHLKTGGGIYTFVFLKQAKDFVNRCEQAIFPVPWEKVKNPQDGKKNGSKTIQIVNAVIKGE